MSRGDWALIVVTALMIGACVFMIMYGLGVIFAGGS